MQEGFIVPVNDQRFVTSDIRLSSALCCLGFPLKIHAQPVDRVYDANKEREIVSFCHEPGPIVLGDNGKLEARHVELWWVSPVGKYTISGYDDALRAIQKVHNCRGAMIRVAKNPGSVPTRPMGADFATDSVHVASIIAARDIPILGYEQPTRRWIFGKEAVLVAESILNGGRIERPTKDDPCIDWMLESLRYHDWLKQIVNNKDCIPVIEARDGDKVLRISTGLSDKEKRKWFTRL